MAEKKQPLSVTHPEIAVEWHPTNNGDLTPEGIVAGSTKKVWWKCPKAADHEWQAVVDKRTRGTGCPACAGQQVSTTNSLASQSPYSATDSLARVGAIRYSVGDRTAEAAGPACRSAKSWAPAW